MTENDAKLILNTRISRFDHADDVTMALEVAKNALEEIQQYHAFGTVEECQEARERQRAKKPIEYEDKYYACPNCGNVLMAKWEKYPLRVSNKKNGLPYCLGCGQSINWSE